MGIDAASSTTVSSSSSATQVSSSAGSENAKKTSSESSFKDEMKKVSTTEKKKDESGVEKAASDKVDSGTEKSDKKSGDALQQNPDDQTSLINTLNGAIDYNQYGTSDALNTANSMLANDIQQMMNSTVRFSAAGETAKAGNIFLFDGLDSANSLSMTESDAQFFINLTQNNDVSMQNIVAQGQTMLNAGAEVAEVKQNVQISQTLLNALNIARENNQPLRIDFEQNVSVILRIGKDGALAANFIPGDKAVEQYLRNNIETLKATFRENDLPYSDLSYSNSSKQQNQRRRNQQQGEQ